jgi:hypothetical protein
MATELVTRPNLETALSSPDLSRWRTFTLGTVKWPGQPERKYLPAGTTLTDDERGRINAKLLQLKALAGEGANNRNDKLAIIAKMLMAYPMANASEETGVARGGAFLDALDDVPPWAIAEAVRKWHRGEAGEGMNYSFAPAPAILRKLALSALRPITSAIEDLQTLATATTLDKAMDQTPPARNSLIPKLRSV